VGYQTVTTAEGLREVAAVLKQQPWFALDTEFVTGATYVPRLCLIQICTADEEVLIDAQALVDLKPFWEVVAAERPVKIVHGGRVEAEFCLRALGRPPAGWFDVQLAAGFLGAEYPAGYANLLERFLGFRIAKAETRSDWRRRPLSPEQIEYALADVRHLPALRDRLLAELEQRDRVRWFEEETALQLAEIADRLSSQPWWKIPRARNLDRRGLAVLRALWIWRETEARQQNRLPRHILRDDLLLELAKRKTADPKQIAALHGFERPALQRWIHTLSLCIKEALSLPEEKLPLPLPPATASPKAGVLCQILFAILGTICQQKEVAVGLVGSPTGVRDWLAYKVFHTIDWVPRLAQGWRAELLGDTFEAFLAGKMCLKVADPRDPFPIQLVPARDGTEPTLDLPTNTDQDLIDQSEEGVSTM
jgi:ribonuclease D